MDKRAFTSASTYPVKLLQYEVVSDIARYQRIRPLHLQLNPTNRCNLKCKFCSCSNKDNHEMPIEQAYDILYRYYAMGTKALTISGGGDPMCYPGINDLIKAASNIGHGGIQVGLVTNGVLLPRLDKGLQIKWCRISVDGDHLISNETIDKIKEMPHVDWAFSYVLQPHNYSNLTRAVLLANELNLTHVRVVDDILSKEESKINHAREILERHGIDLSRVIFQGRKDHTPGCKECRIGLIKPNIDAHGDVYSCCGIQYSKATPDLNFNKEFSLGNDYEGIVERQIVFDGTKCDVCYYCQYNAMLGSILEAQDIEHGKFI